MPLSTRDWAIREIERAVKNIDWTGTHLIRVAEAYKKQHPEIAIPIENNLETLLSIQNNVTDIKDNL